MTKSSVPQITWILPKIGEILEPPRPINVDEKLLVKRARQIEETLASFEAPGQVVKVFHGPAATIFGVEPLFIQEKKKGQIRVHVGMIASLADDLALALETPAVTISIPDPGRSFVTIEVPNKEVEVVGLREVLESQAFSANKSSLEVVLGKDVAGHTKVVTLESMPHLLIAGTTGSGKSICIHAILTCLLLHNTPDDLRFVLVDTKRVELTCYNGIPHLLAPVIVEPERAIGALQWMAREMENRFRKFAQVGVRSIQDFNQCASTQGSKTLPFLLFVIDELSDIMLIVSDETKSLITRLAKLARATGIHLILTTSRPSMAVVTGEIKAFFPARIAFSVASKVDSRIILDQTGAEKLRRRGEMLFQAADSPNIVRLQGVFISDMEINRLAEYWRQQLGASS